MSSDTERPERPAAPSTNEKASPEDTFSILVATDNHLGYAEKDPVRKEDSFEAFEEILQLAQKRQVDMILLGGDVFHENKPSRPTVVRTMELLRRYCWGSKEVNFEILSDAKSNFPPLKFGKKEFGHPVNFLDDNINVAIPVFAIHGNHDDPAGEGGLCALDILSGAGLINYFGKSDTVDSLKVSPILMRKGRSYLAMYGFGNIRDERLYQTFKASKVQFMRPNELQNEWFNLLVLHQNRVKHGPTAYVPENWLEDFLDFIIWGHEHECILEPSLNVQSDFHILQPGSSVATALSEGESKPKHAFILKIFKNRWRVEALPLTTVRPFILEDVVLADQEGLTADKMDDVTTFLEQRVVELIEKVRDDWSSKNAHLIQPGEDRFKLMPSPLVRLKVEITGFTNFNVQRFGQQFVHRVANPKDILIFYRKKIPIKRIVHKDGKEVEEIVEEEGDENDDDIMNRMALRPVQLDAAKVDDLVNKYLQGDKKLEILPEGELADAVRLFVEKEEKDAIKEFLDKSLNITKDHLNKKPDLATADEDFRKEIEKEKEVRLQKYLEKKSKEPLLSSQVSTAPAKKRRRGDEEEDDDDNNDDVMDEDDNNDSPAASSPAPVARGRGSRGGRARAATTTTTTRTTKEKAPSRRAASSTKETAAASRTKSKKRGHDDEDEDEEKEDEEFIVEDDDDVIEDQPPKKKPRAAPAPKAKASSSRSARQTKLTFTQDETVDDDATPSQPSSSSSRQLPAWLRGKK